jgi:hypothetical protein
VRVKLAKNPADYAVDNPNKKIEMLLGAKIGEVILYFERDKGVSINAENISVLKCEEILLIIVKDALEI